MALAPCKECRKEISTSAPICPNCGVPWPASYTKGKIVFHRLHKMTGISNAMQVSINNQRVCRLASGDKFSVELDPGKYVIQVSSDAKISNAKSEQLDLIVENSKEYILSMYFEIGLIKSSIKLSIV